MQFYKYHGLGNDYLIIDPATAPTPLNQPLVAPWAVAICDRQRGVGADGIVHGPLPQSTDNSFACEIWNPDGSRAEVSGNGLRIFARYLLDAGYVAPVPDATIAFTLHSGGRAVPVLAHADGLISVTLGEAHVRFLQSVADLGLDETNDGLGAPVLIDVGNPHCVFFPDAHLPVNPALARQWGAQIEHAPLFPQRTNVQFARVRASNYIDIEIWERGAGYTLASGSSSCAVAVAAVASGRCQSPVTVHMAGGSLIITVEHIDARYRVTLTGPVTPVFGGNFDARWLDALTG